MFFFHYKVERFSLESLKKKQSKQIPLYALLIGKGGLSAKKKGNEPIKT